MARRARAEPVAMDPSRRRPLPKSAKPCAELALFLKFLRLRIDRDVRVLGPYARLPSRRGKLVSQEELAEAAGVTREWYSRLEGGATTRTSLGLIDRLADVLMVTPEERATLFRLAVPEFGRVHLRDDSIAALEAFSRLRSLFETAMGSNID
jgi:transcriptional regulator with XRE-family HTH domain